MATPYGESKGVAKRQPEWGHHLSRRDKWRLWPSLNARRRSAALAAGEERIYARAGRPRRRALERPSSADFLGAQEVGPPAGAGPGNPRRRRRHIWSAPEGHEKSLAGRIAANPKPSPGRARKLKEAAARKGGRFFSLTGRARGKTPRDA